MMQSMVPFILFNDDVNTMAYVMHRVFGLGIYVIDRVLVLKLWWVGWWACIGFIHLQHA